MLCLAVAFAAAVAHSVENQCAVDGQSLLQLRAPMRPANLTLEQLAERMDFKFDWMRYRWLARARGGGDAHWARIDRDRVTAHVRILLP